MRSILITGGTGTMGRAIVRELLKSQTQRIVIFSRDELKQHEMKLELSDPRLRFFLGDVRDLQRLRRAFEGVEAVIHAAALKQVESSEFNPFEAIKTNVIGSQNVIEAAIDTQVSRVLGISTDKATLPTSLYGATKLCSERLFIAGNVYAGNGRTRLAAMRCGNITNSRGSVIPKWKGLLSEKKKVPVTDPECTRYWITEEEAAKFALQSLQDMKGGEIFVPNLKAFRVGDLAQAMNAETEIVGLGPGEKLHEAMIAEHEAHLFGRTDPLVSNTAERMSVKELSQALLHVEHSI